MTIRARQSVVDIAASLGFYTLFEQFGSKKSFLQSRIFPLAACPMSRKIFGLFLHLGQDVLRMGFPPFGRELTGESAMEESIRYIIKFHP